jgi:hypothetical protein
VSRFLPPDSLFEICKLSLFKVDLVSHEFIHCSVGSMVNMGVRVHISACFRLCPLVILLFFLDPSSHQSTLLSILVQSLSSVIWVGCCGGELGTDSGSLASCLPSFVCSLALLTIFQHVLELLLSPILIFGQLSHPPVVILVSSC